MSALSAARSNAKSRESTPFLDFCGVCTLTAAQAEEPRIPPQYAPLYPEIYKTSTHKTGTLIGDFVHARSALDWKEAEARWSAFLARYDSKDYEDAIHARLARLAQTEQMRVLYALGKIHEADIVCSSIASESMCRSQCCGCLRQRSVRFDRRRQVVA